MKTLSIATALAAFVLTPTLAHSQVVDSLAAIHDMTVRAITATADQVPEHLYSFRPNEDVRTLGQILGHIADGNYSICSAASGQDNPNANSIEQTKTSKADIQQALAEAFAYCQGIYETMSDATGAETTTFFGGQPFARAAILAFNSTHNYEHYGNLVTYMRINDIVPPTSMPQ